MFVLLLLAIQCHLQPPPLEEALLLPKVFEIGTNEEEYEQLLQYYSNSLLDVCSKDTRLAFRKLIAMYKEMEAFAANANYDVGGVRIWVHVFWNADGTIQHLAFHLRPNSRNIDKNVFKAFLTDFVRVYKMPLISEQPYSLYTSVSFPVTFRTTSVK